MTHFKIRNLVVISALLSGAGSAFAQTPTCATPACNSVTSDAYGNTGVGSGTLSSDQPTALVNYGGPGDNNTAVGSGSLATNTSGQANVAVGTAALSSNTTGNSNTATGTSALVFNTIGNSNTATGVNALLSNTTGNSNTAIGANALQSNTTGGANDAVGAGALLFNTTGSDNNAMGRSALNQNTTGHDNSALGDTAMSNNTSGVGNVAMGSGSLNANTTGGANTGVGAGTLKANTIGNYNTAMGFQALFSTNSDGVGSDGSYNNAMGLYAMYANTTGYNNNAQGSYALYANTTGYGNSAMGANSLMNLTTGVRNVGVGNNTGTSLVVGSYNVDIGWGVSGSGDESGVIRIGSPSYATATYIAGVYGVAAGGTYVCATSSGQLSTGASCAAPSSRRYKEDIRPLTDTERLMKLQPVSFRYRKADASGNKPLEFGLIAEEVAQVFPDLVVYDEKGRPDAVKYQDLTPILLKKIQQQQAQIAAQDAKMVSLETMVRDMQQQVARLNAEAKEPQIAMR
jgi:hypothetical protein